MRQRLESDRSSAKSRYGSIIQEQAPERTAANERYGQRYGELQKGYGNLAETGGIDPGEAARLRKGFGGFAETGGLDPNTTSNLKSFYGGMRTSGGYTGQDVANIRGRSNAGIPAVYQRLKENLRTAQARGGSAGYGATLAKLGRQSAQDTATTARDTEVDIADRLRQGKLTGAAGEFGLENALRAGKLQGLQSGQGLEESLRSGRNLGLAGIGNLATNDFNQFQQYDRNKMAAEGATDAAIGQTNSADLSLSTRPGWGSNLMNGLQTAAGFAAPFLGGFGQMFGRNMPAYDPNFGVGPIGAPELPEYKYPGLGG